ncbi:fructokinase-like 2, chloroplastic [Heracleum sosnowskyi]|uniref:Fructokinase-like 2, chloroplastic n=1 Tax=Heracleum sosnowskyi TaxID=360622 RepID=A0AAD8MYR3_9APIA|nr:fructokinase-like 2, chloroplastic [Heracleum sosnowskyi]
MASLCFTQFYVLPRWQSNLPFFPSIQFIQPQDIRLRSRCIPKALSKKKVSESLAGDASDGEGEVVEKKVRKTLKRSPARGRRKAKAEIPEDSLTPEKAGGITDDEAVVARRRTRKKASVVAESTSGSLVEEEPVKKVTRRRKTKKKIEDPVDQVSETELSDSEGETDDTDMEDDDDNEKGLNIDYDDGEDDISFTYGWPPLVCCFGSAQHSFVPSGRPAHRLLDYEMHERMKDALWAPEKFIRAPGSCSSNVALALANLGGKVAFMGKLGDDDYGQALLLYLNENKVQTRSVRIDSRRITAVSQMKIGKRGGLRMTSVKPCAEDSLSKSEINIDVLKEAQMFYFNTFSLLDQKMRSTALQAIKISKKLGSLIFYDVNLPLPLWKSGEETKMFIQQAWNLADVIEVTTQELEFLCGIKPSENFDTKNNKKTKFPHYAPEVLAPLWHENLKLLFVTNGTSKIHYYTKEHDGAVLGMEDPPLTPFSCDMSAAGDGIVAALMRKLTIRPNLITDKGYLEHTIKYAINCGVTDQWLQARIRGFPPKEGMEGDMAPDINGLMSITERQYRTLVPVSSTS